MLRPAHGRLDGIGRGATMANGKTDRYADAVVEAILTVLHTRDETAFADARATGAWCRRLAESLHLSRARTDLVVIAGVLHDAGAAMLADFPALAVYAPIVGARHERWDGSGYPLGLKGEQIPYEARVVAVAGAFHAMISDRPRQPAIAQRHAMTVLRDGRGARWDAAVVDAMLNVLDAPRTTALSLSKGGKRYAAQP
jgi:HD-GYP domain-containing protein (c-di-GMP phosphodiesterase class II)